MSIIFRTAGPWGAGQGSDLAAAQVDNNFYELVTSIVNLEDVPAGVGIVYITVSGATFTVHLTDHSIEGPFPLPVAQWIFRGEWQASTPYVVNDVITAGGSLYIVIFNHTSADVFDPNANDGMGHNYYLLVLEPFGVLPAGGAADQVLAKHSGADYDTFWKDEASPQGVPAGGTAGQALVKHSGADYDTAWGLTLSADGLPAGGTVGQIVFKSGSGDYVTAWGNPPAGVPAGGLTAQVLAKHSGADYDTFWQTPDTVATTWYSGNGAPTTLFNDGDYYLDLLTGNVYKQISAVWALQGNIKGPAGTAGTNGTNGANGTIWYNGSAVPTFGSPAAVNGDYYYRITNGDVYQLQSGSWVLIGNLTPALPTGGTTGQVLTKNSSTNFDASWQTPSGGGGSGAKWPRRNGSITAPGVASGWTTLGTGTLADFTAGSDAGLRLTAAGNGSNHLFGIYKSQSFGADFTLSAGIRLHTPIVDSVGFGVLLWQTSNSKGYFMGIGNATTFGRWKWDGSATSFDGTNDYGSSGLGGYGSKTFIPEFYIRVALVGSNLNFYWSYDGNYWMLLKTLTTTEYNASSFNSLGLGINRNLNTGNFNFELAMDCADYNLV